MIYKNIDLEKLMQLMEKYETAEICLRDGKTSIEIKRGAHESAPSAPRPRKETLVTSPEPHSEPPPAEAKSEQPAQEALTAPPAEASNIKEVTAPLVGTFYRAPAPDAGPYVEIGDRVKAGDTLCIVEAMKNMNEIESDMDGTIMEICIQNAELVEFGQVLFKIEVAG
jgi:acetyl-CoA carboxylase biotin carboxyl carrier protein